MDAALTVIHDYYRAFSTLDAEACAPFFALPCLFLGLERPLAARTREELAGALVPITVALKTQDYQRSEFLEPRLTTLTGTTTLVRGVAVRYRASGAELERVPVTYLVHRTGDASKIAVVTAALRWPGASGRP